ncbi:recombination mediator RecR [bacterium]|nr:recombination mediator RecR [bacterium]MBU1153049.1 recombination mediator RecR [bacterium]MBU2600025.1 recombination mediator RecR [bacterium]
MQLASSMLKLVNEFSKLPTIGSKTAQRLAFYILKTPREEVLRLSQSLLEVKDKIKYCQICFNISQEEVCLVCSNNQRDSSLICVVELPFDVIVVEKSGNYQGRYHVLLGNISPLEGIGPEDLKIKELLGRLQKEKIKEVIVATNSNIEGETTAIYLHKLIKPLGIYVSRIAYGLPVGGNLEYADEVTIAKAIEGRRPMN